MHNRAFRVGAWGRSIPIFALLAASACVPVGFRPARTVTKGEVEHSLGVMGFQVDSPAMDDTIGERPKPPKMTIPGASYQLRYGAAQGIDVGVGVASLGAVTAEATFELLRSEVVDVAIGTSFACDFVDVPLPALATPILVDLNLGRAASIVGYAAPVVYWPKPEADRVARMLFQVGVGLDLRAASWLSLRPHAGVVGPMEPVGNEGFPIPFAGIGIALGGDRGF